MKNKNESLKNTMNIILSNEELVSEINTPVIQKVQKEEKEVKRVIKNTTSKKLNNPDGELSDSITLLLYSDLKFKIDQHVINYDIKYNTFYSNVINHFYSQNEITHFEKIDELKETIKVRIVCNKEDKKNIRLFVKENKITLREFFTAFIEHYLSNK